MDTSDYIELGAGLALGGILTRGIADSLNQGIDAHTAIRVLTLPQTAAEIQTLLDKLDVRLANGEISEAIYQVVTAKWQARLQALAPATANKSS